MKLQQYRKAIIHLITVALATLVVALTGGDPDSISAMAVGLTGIVSTIFLILVPNEQIVQPSPPTP